MRLRNILILLAILMILGGAYNQFGRPASPPPPEPVDYVWLIEMDDIIGAEFRLPRENASQKFVKIVKGDSFPWFFDDAAKSPVDQVRWSSGIPLLLSGPSAERKVAEDASPEDMARFGLDSPQLEIKLELADGQTMLIEVGDRTPDGSRTYVRAPNTNAVATVDVSWFDLMVGIVKNPPYAKAQ